MQTLKAKRYGDTSLFLHHYIVAWRQAEEWGHISAYGHSSGVEICPRSDRDGWGMLRK